MKSMKRLSGILGLSLAMTVACFAPANADIRQETLTEYNLAR